MLSSQYRRVDFTWESFTCSALVRRVVEGSGEGGWDVDDIHMALDISDEYGLDALGLLSLEDDIIEAALQAHGVMG